MKRILVGVIVAVTVSSSALAGPSEEGWAAYQRGDYETALKLWRPLAAQGNAFDQSNLGFMYDSGQGVPRDLSEAAKWYRLAAEQGNPRAQSNIGSMYAAGEGACPRTTFRLMSGPASPPRGFRPRRKRTVSRRRAIAITSPP